MYLTILRPSNIKADLHEKRKQVNTLFYYHTLKGFMYFNQRKKSLKICNIMVMLNICNH